MAITVACSAFLPKVAHAQGRIPGAIQRIQVGFSYTKGFAQYESIDQKADDKGNLYTQTNKIDVTSKAGWGGLVGTSIPVKRLGTKSILAIGVDFMYNIYVWDYKAPYFNGFAKDSTGTITGLDYNDSYSFDGVSVQLALPVSADFKFGCDAIADKTVRFCGTVGAGAYPSLAATVDASNAGYGFGIVPFVKAEFGVMGGICFKIRTTYAIGKIPYYTSGNSVSTLADFNSTSSLTGKSSFAVSLIFMPLAWKWKTTGWWNTY